MKRICKIRIYPNKTQTKLIYDTLSCCRYVKNMYIRYNIDKYQEDKSFISGYDFSKILNKLKKCDPTYSWLCDYSSKAIKDSIMDIDKTFKRFFRKTGGFPKFKSRKRINKESYFFIKDNIHYVDKYHIKIPVLGKMRITESNYLPDIDMVTSGRVIREYDKFYISLIYDTNKHIIPTSTTKIALDVGIKNYCTIYTSNNKVFYINHFKDYNNYKKLDDKIKRLQQIISNKVEINYFRKLNNYLDSHNGEEPSEKYKNIMKGESYNSSRIRRLQRKIRILHKKKNNIRKDFIYNLVNNLTAIAKPKVITIEDLDITDMTKHSGTKDSLLHKYIMESGFYLFKLHLIHKCEYYGIKLRLADRYFASSKICSSCGNKNTKLALNDRIYECPECGLSIDRDLNAAINLLNLKDKKCIIL